MSSEICIFFFFFLIVVEKNLLFANSTVVQRNNKKKSFLWSSKCKYTCKKSPNGFTKQRQLIKFFYSKRTT